MKAPNMNTNFFLQHGEKIVVAIFAVSALGLAWGGLDALRTQSVTETQTPDSLVRGATQADTHIEAEKTAPPEVVNAALPLTQTLQPWRSAQPVEPTFVATLDKPLFEELAKRGRPAVMPVEDLRAIAGIAVLPSQQPAEPAAAPVEEDAPKRTTGRRGRTPPPTETVFPSPTLPGPQQQGPPERGTVVPFVIVTGLIPVEKQRQEYGRRFLAASFRDEQRDSPLWSDFEVDRCIVEGGNQEQWETIDLAAVMKQWRDQWADNAPDLLPPTFQLSEFEDRRNPKSSPIEFNCLLPQRIDGGWGAEAVHPYFFAKALEQAPRVTAETADDSVVENEPAAPGTGAPYGGRSGMMPPGRGGSRGRMGGSYGVSRPPDSMMPGMEGSAGMSGGSYGISRPPDSMMPGMEGSPDMSGGSYGISRPPDSMMPGMGSRGMMGGRRGGRGRRDPGMGGPRPRQGDGIEFKQFRFIDTAVEPGKSYRYRVRLKVWNPNLGIPAQHLTDASLAADQKLTSPDSSPSSFVRIPDPTSLLAGTRLKADAKKVKPGVVDVFVLASSAESGNYSLRSVLLDVGGIANVDGKLNKPGDTRSRGDDIVTDRLLVDVQGRQEPRDEIKGTFPPEPLEMLFLRPDGGFEFVSAADSAARVEQYSDGLPSFDEGGGRRDPKADAPATTIPFDSPFAPPGSKKSR